MKIALIGKAGQVATEVQRQVNPQDSLIVLARPMLDLADAQACAAKVRALDADVILNAAAYTAVDAAETDEATATLVNADSVSAMARAAASSGIPFLHVSTDYVYDGSGTAAWRPDSPTGPLGAYGRTKLAGDLGVIAAGGPHAILRTSWVFSAHGNNFVKTMLRLGRAQATQRSQTKDGQRSKLTIVADQIGGPTAAADIASALLKMAEAFHAGRAQTGIHHFSGAPEVSWADFAREIFRQAGLDCDVEDIPTSAYPTPATRPANSRLDCSGLQEAYGISRPDWRLGLADVLKELSHVPA